MNTHSLALDPYATTPRPPRVLRWITLVNLAGLTSAAAGVRTECLFEGLPPIPWANVAVAALVAVGLAGCLRRGAGWAYALQTAVLVLLVVASSGPGVLWVPALVAWCDPSVRDWFCPPQARGFGPASGSRHP